MQVYKKEPSQHTVVSQTELVQTARTNEAPPSKMNMDLNSSFTFNNAKTLDGREKKQSSILLAGSQQANKTMNIVDDTLSPNHLLPVQEHLSNGTTRTNQIEEDEAKENEP
jgi:hypothetical protein